jgi:hypothetical protein
MRLKERACGPLVERNGTFEMEQLIDRLLTHNRLVRDAETFRTKLGGLFGGKEVGDFLVRIANDKTVESDAGGRVGSVNNGNDGARVHSNNVANGTTTRQQVNGASSATVNGNDS